MSKTERAIKHYVKNPVIGEWGRQRAEVSIEKEPFSQGSFRQAYKAKLIDCKDNKLYVAKFAMDSNTPNSVYYNDIEAEKVASYWAAMFNREDPPQEIQFIDSFVLELVDRPGRPVCGMEEYIPGEFKKHNNNVGAVSRNKEFTKQEQFEVDLAQAFSHFTFERSDHQIMVCDIQGTPGSYTDPQIHTIDGSQYGEGNLGRTGIKAFLMRHKCNDVCKGMNLPCIDLHTLEQSLIIAEAKAPEVREQQKQLKERNKQRKKIIDEQMKRSNRAKISSSRISSTSTTISTSPTVAAAPRVNIKPSNEQVIHRQRIQNVPSPIKKDTASKSLDDDDEDLMASIMNEML